jgi:protein SCO1/2
MTFARPLIACFLLVLCVACQRGDEAFRATDITGAQFARDFTLTDHDGKRRSLSDFRGKAVVVFFGFTHCPDVCPTTLAELAGAMKKIGKDADRVQVLLVTIDPERDTAGVLKPYVTAFDPRFLGLRGTADETAAVAKEFKVIYQKAGDGKDANYTMDHSAGSYVFDAEGRIRLYVGYGAGSDVFAHDIGRLLAGR